MLHPESDPVHRADGRPEPVEEPLTAASSPDGPSDAGVRSQPVAGPLTQAAIFLTLSVRDTPECRPTIRSLCGDLPALVRAVGFREPERTLSCIVGFGSSAWDALIGAPRPVELHPFREIRAGPRHAPATPGDFFVHLRADRMDLCFEMETQILARIRSVTEVADEVQGFRYFDNRDLIGFVDGTENPEGAEAAASVYIGAEDPPFAGGSYVIVQKYLHDLDGWNGLPVEEQERIVGRRKLSDIELADDVKPSNAHNALTTIVENGKEVSILRDNMPFGSPAKREFGTYFIGYSRSPRTIERMLENMFVGDPPGNYDRLLDYSRPLTGALFFVPSATFLESVGSSSD
jgi:porphyrinogen peroxidase